MDYEPIVYKVGDKVRYGSSERAIKRHKEEPEFYPKSNTDGVVVTVDGYVNFDNSIDCIEIKWHDGSVSESCRRWCSLWCLVKESE